MLQGYTHTQALRLYRKYGVRVAVPLSALAMRKARARKGAASSAGLAELSFVALPHVHRALFESNESFDTWLLQERAAVHAATVQAEMHA